MNIYAFNPDLSNAEKTYLASGLAAATPAVLKVKNSNNFTNARKVLIGTPCRERTEMATQSSKTSTSITVAATSFAHDADDPVYTLQFDQVRFYRSTTGVSGTYNLLTTLDIDWDNSNGKTTYNDVNALSSYFYKIAYFDSILTIESDLSDPIQSIGYADNSAGELISSVASEIGDPDFMDVSIDTWMSYADDVGKDLLKQAKKPYRFLKAKETIDVGTDDNSFPWPIDLWKINYVEVNQYNSGGNPLREGPKLITNQLMRFRQSRALNPSDYVNEIAYDDEDKTVLFNPSARTDRIGAFIFHYYKFFTKLSNFSQILETPDNLVYKYGLKMRYYFNKMDSDDKYSRQYNEMQKMYQAEIRMLQREKNVDVHGPSSMGADRKRYSQWGVVRYRQ